MASYINKDGTNHRPRGAWFNIGGVWYWTTEAWVKKDGTWYRLIAP